jgi:uncharacterized membrane protein YgcG
MDGLRIAMNRLTATTLTALALVSLAVPALARDAFVTDGASMFSQATVDSLNRQIVDFNRRTGKEVVVVTVPSLNGQTIQDAAERAFAQQQVNGVLIYLAKAERQDLVVGDRASRAFFPPGTFANIHDAMRGYFRQGDFDAGITTGVNLVLDQYRGHERALAAPRSQPVSRPLAPASSQQSTGGFHLSFFWLLIILLAGFLIIRALFRAISGPRMIPPGGPGYGGPGYGPGYGGPGYGGGGGSFFSGLLGGLGGAFIGNELFGGRGGGASVAPGSDVAGVAGGDAGAAADSSGWQSDAGQADVGGAGGGDWGGGGGFDSGGGGDFGGGGGGGDGGGGW